MKRVDETCNWIARLLNCELVIFSTLSDSCLTMVDFVNPKVKNRWIDNLLWIIRSDCLISLSLSALLLALFVFLERLFAQFFFPALFAMLDT